MQDAPVIKEISKKIFLLIDKILVYRYDKNITTTCYYHIIKEVFV